MDLWRLHWLEASGDLSLWSNEINQEFESAYTEITKHIEPPHLDAILIQSNSRGIIPEFGLGGSAYSSFLFWMYFDPSNKNFKNSLMNGALQRVIVHEVHHCLRMRSVGYGQSLGEAIISEGLAGHFSRLIYANPPEPWECETDLNDALKYVDDGKEFRSTTYDHQAWFSGSTKQYPRWLGYSLGYGIVGHWMKQQTELSFDMAINTPAEEILASLN